MKDSRSLLLLLVSLLLVVVSFILVWTWGYDYYKNRNATSTVEPAFPADSATVINRLRDSLQKTYTSTLQNLDLQLDSTLSHSDSLRAELDLKLAAFYRLRSEIVTILKNRSTSNNYAEARQKIGELQNKMEDLKLKNQDVERENKKLNDLLKEFGNTEKPLERSNTPLKPATTERPSPMYGAFIASDLRLAAVVNNGDKETETTVAEKTNKFNISFTVMNFNAQQVNAEVMVVVRRPDGVVLKSSSWDSGTFNTPDGKKVYSYKFNFSYTRGEAKRLAFSMKPGNLIKGNYSLDVYQNGMLIAQAVKTLS